MKYEAKGCPIRFSLSIFGDKWSLLIIRDLMFKGRRYYGEFLKAGENISTSVLANRLEQLEASGIIQSEPDPDHGKKIRYSLTQQGKDLIDVMLAMVNWSEQYDVDTEVPADFIQQLRKNPKTLRNKVLKTLEK